MDFELLGREMVEKENKAELDRVCAEAAEVGRLAARARCAAILLSDQAKGCTAAARILAFDTDIEPDLALQLLALYPTNPTPASRMSRVATPNVRAAPSNEPLDAHAAQSQIDAGWKSMIEKIAMQPGPPSPTERTPN